MPRASRLVERSIVILTAITACRRDDPPPAPAPVPVPVPAPVPAPVPPPVPVPVPPPAPPPPLAHRCALDGNPIVGGCSGGGTGIAIDRSNTIYLTVGAIVLRYTRAPGAGCTLTRAGERIQLPADIKRPQRLDAGPIYMRSGGVAWHLVSTGDATYAYDFLAGLYRIDRGKAEPACTDVFGYESLAAHGGKLLVNRDGIEELVLGPRCTARKIRDGRGRLYSARDELYLASPAFELSRVRGRELEPLDVKPCSVNAIVACGEGACVVDGNCGRINSLANARTFDFGALFDARPYMLPDATTARDGTVYAIARHRIREKCETAVYAIPPDVFR